MMPQKSCLFPQAPAAQAEAMRTVKLRELMDYGILQAPSVNAALARECLEPLHTAGHLHRGYGPDWFVAVILVKYLQRIALPKQ